MALRTLLAAAGIASALALSACGTSSNSDTKDAAMSADPFEAYLPWDADAKGVQTTTSGLQYLVLKEGPADGLAPTARDEVTVHYDGRLATGEKFDSSYDRGSPSTFGVSRVISGWTEGLQLMSEGDEYLFYIPNDLAYGNQARGEVIKAGDDLVFRVELEKVTTPKTTDREAWNKYLPWPEEDADIIRTESGIEYIVLASGEEGGTGPTGGEIVVVHYEGRFAETGETFDSSYQAGEPAMFPANRVIPGWVEMLKLMKPGDRVMVHIPSKLGYGETGTPGGPIPPNTDLQFEVELLDVLQVQ